MGDLSSIDWSVVDEDSGTSDFSPVPAGTYTVEITKAEMKPTKKFLSGEKKRGLGLTFEFTIISEEHNSRKIWHFCNIENESVKCENVGKADVKKIAKACGLKKLNDTEDFSGGILQIKTAIESSVEWGDKTKVVGFIGDNKEKPKAAAKEVTDLESDVIPF